MRRDAVTFPGHKVCWLCKDDKPDSEYSKLRSSPGKLHYICKSCSNIRAKKWYAENRERGKANRLAWARELRKRAVLAIGGYSCRCCGESHASMLDIDHIDGDGAAHRKSVGGMLSVYHDVIAEPKRFQMLCCNCNQSKRRLGKNKCEHELEVAWARNIQV